MLKDANYIYRRLNIASDIIISGTSFLCAIYFKTFLKIHSFVLPYPYQRYFWLFYVVSLLWPLLLNINGIYPTNRLRTLRRSVTIILRSSLQGLFIVLAFLFILRLQIVSRLIILRFTVIVTLLLILKEILVAYCLHTLRQAGANLRNLLVVGTAESTRNIIKIIKKNSFLGLNIIGILVPLQEENKKEISGHKVLGDLKDIEKILKNNPIDNVIVTIDRKDYTEVDDVIYHCEEEGTEVWLTASIFNIKMAKLDADEIFGIPVFVLHMGPNFSWTLFIKGILDRMGAVVLGLLTLPILLMAIAAIKVTSKGPVFFKQQRCGLKGRKFIFYKLRTMYKGSEDMRDELEADNIMKGPVFKTDNDPRVTPVGRFLRKFSIDEIPQFWNVLKGDMSIIGPRPPIPEEVKKYKAWQRRRLSMKPGITGLWQVSGRSDITDFNEWAELDLKYIDNWSLWLDFSIFFKTIIVVLSTKGAK